MAGHNNSGLVRRSGDLIDSINYSDGSKILPPAYTRQPGRPKTKRVKEASEKVVNGTAKAGRTQRSLKCGNCRQQGHNMLTCKSHISSKKATATNKKRSSNAGTVSQQQKEKRAPMTANELRKKVKERAEYQRKKKKMATLRAEKLDANRLRRGRPSTRTSMASTALRPLMVPTPTTASTASRPPPVPTPTTSSNNNATATRSSKRVRRSSGKG